MKKLVKNTGISYEKIVQQIFQAILDQTDVNNVSVQQNVILKGKMTNHQIDVYWEFEIGGIVYSTIVQAKDWNQPVKQGELLAFSQILNDIPGQPKGIFITRTGYQEGAKKIAEANGILLYELREPTERDWEGRIKDINIKMNVTVPQVKNIQVNFDRDWILKEKTEKDITGEDFYIAKQADEIIFIDGKDNKISTAYDIFQQHLDKISHEGLQNYEYLFEKDTFLLTDSELWPKIKINSMSFDAGYHIYNNMIEMRGDEIVRFIMKNVLEGIQKSIGKDLKPLEKRLTSSLKT